MNKNRLIIAGVATALATGVALAVKNRVKESKEDNESLYSKDNAKKMKRIKIWNYDDIMNLNEEELKEYNSQKIKAWDDAICFDDWSFGTFISEGAGSISNEELTKYEDVLLTIFKFISKNNFLVLGEYELLVKDLESKTIFNQAAIRKGLNLIYLAGYIDFDDTIKLPDATIVGDKLVFLSYPAE